jgi:NAD(P)-dependent dehydrogenase (short-subunit alcohol dehydrogenase family)
MSKTILITGASRGIGRAAALRAANDGYDVAVAFHESKDNAEEVAKMCRSYGRQAITVQADISNEADVVAMFETIDREFGHLNAFVANAGIGMPHGRLETFSKERIDRVFAVNVVGTMLCAREAVLRMSSGNGGAIVFVSSASSRLGSGNVYVDYAATKGAIDTLTIGLSREVIADGIRVNAVRPGLIDTEFHASIGDPDRPARLGPTFPIGRSGTVEEVADAIAWLLSDQSNYVVGSIIDIAGGL